VERQKGGGFFVVSGQTLFIKKYYNLNEVNIKIIEDPMRNVSVIIITAIVVLILCIALLNSYTITINYIVSHVTVRLPTLLVIIFILGGLFGYLLGMRGKRKPLSRLP